MKQVTLFYVPEVPLTFASLLALTDIYLCTVPAPLGVRCVHVEGHTYLLYVHTGCSYVIVLKYN